MPEAAWAALVTNVQGRVIPASDDPVDPGPRDVDPRRRPRRRAPRSPTCPGRCWPRCSSDGCEAMGRKPDCPALRLVATDQKRTLGAGRGRRPRTVVRRRRPPGWPPGCWAARRAGPAHVTATGRPRCRDGCRPTDGPRRPGVRARQVTTAPGRRRPTSLPCAPSSRCPTGFPPAVLAEAGRAAARRRGRGRAGSTPPTSSWSRSTRRVRRTSTRRSASPAAATGSACTTRSPTSARSSRRAAPLDAEVRRRGQTVYLPDGSVPLHPPVLSEGAASLLPDGPRAAVLWTIDLDADG